MVRAAGCGALLLALVVALAAAPPPDTEQKKPVDLIGVLSKPVDIRLEDNTPLLDVVELLRDRYGITVLINREAFNAEGVQEVAAHPLKAPTKHAVIRLNTFLRLITNQLNGAFLLRPDHIEITTAKRARAEWSLAEIWVRGEIGNSDPSDVEIHRPMPPLVHARFAARPLDEALEELADMAGITVIVDARRAGDKAKTPITAKLVNMPLDTAVRALADIAELRAVIVDNGLYVTTKENAQSLQAEQDKRRQVSLAQQYGPGGIVPGAAGAPAAK